MNKARPLVATILLLASAWLHAAELRPFASGDMARLVAEHRGRPFIVTFWSTDCPHCKTTLRQLSAWAERHRNVDLAVVNTDGPEAAQSIGPMLSRVGLGARATWVFADTPERLRYEIDRRWGGELPRSYLFDGEAGREAFSGPVAADALQRLAAGGHGGPRP